MFSDKIAHILNVFLYGIAHILNLLLLGFAHILSMFAYNCELVLHRREVIAKRQRMEDVRPTMVCPN